MKSILVFALIFGSVCGARAAPSWPSPDGAQEPSCMSQAMQFVQNTSARSQMQFDQMQMRLAELTKENAELKAKLRTPDKASASH